MIYLLVGGGLLFGLCCYWIGVTSGYRRGLHHGRIEAKIYPLSVQDFDALTRERPRD